MAVYFPTDTCHLFSPGHHVHGIQWRKSQQTDGWRSVRLLSGEGMVCRVQIGGVEETWRFHDEDAEIVATWTKGSWAKLSEFSLLRLPNGGYLYPCRTPERWQDCRVQSPALPDETAEDRVAHDLDELGGVIIPFSPAL